MVSLFASFNQVTPPPGIDFEIKVPEITYTDYIDDFSDYQQPIIEDIQTKYSNQSRTKVPDLTTKVPDIKQDEEGIERIDIEDLLKKEGFTQINGKKIKFGSREVRPQNANYGAANSHHKRADKYTGFASARDISIEGGNDEDYAEFRRLLLNNPRILNYMNKKGWGIINELSPEILRSTRGTGRHFHFGPDQWALQTWNTWISNPNIPINIDVRKYGKTRT